MGVIVAGRGTAGDQLFEPGRRLGRQLSRLLRPAEISQFGHVNRRAWPSTFSPLAEPLLDAIEECFVNPLQCLVDRIGRSARFDGHLFGVPPGKYIRSIKSRFSSSSLA